MLIKLKAGLDLDLGAAPQGPVQDGPSVSQVALVGPDYQDVRFAVTVTEGARVKLGETVFNHRKYPELCFTAPGAGVVKSVNRGARRRLMSVVIALDGDGEVQFPSFSAEALGSLSPDDINKSLLASGLWTSFRTRPYNRIPDPGTCPRAIFVTAMNTSPGAADPVTVITGQSEAFRDGLSIISRLSTERTYLCKTPGSPIPEIDADGLVTAEFQGPHPAGLPGTHMHYLEPVTDRADLWHIGYQDVISIGKLFRTGRLWTERIVALSGPGVERPRLVRTRIGASLQQLLTEESVENCRIVSGDLLSGRQATLMTAYLGRYHQQISLLPEIAAEAAVSHGPNNKGRNITTATHGWPAGMLAVEAFDRVWPMQTPPIPLLRALLMKDTEAAIQLGCLGLAEEDLALCSYVCPAKYDYGAALRETLREIRRGA
jgi:Na+-transporting NADH:ubiquinone oxidoreductase subunit A